MMVDQNLLDGPVTAIATSPEIKSALLSSLWGPNLSPRMIQSGGLDTDPYLEYCSQQCDIFSIEQSTYAAPHGSPWPGIATHQDLVSVVERLATDPRERKHIIHDLQKLQQTFQTEKDPSRQDAADGVQAVENAIDWAARIVTMMEIGRPRCAFSAQKPLLWESGSLQDFVANQFSPNRIDAGHVRLQKIFTARNLERLAGIKIEWTSNLADHLSLKEDDTKVMIFHHATFLEHARTDIFPSGFCAETLRTLALLLPSSDRKTIKWYRKHQSTQALDSRAVKCPRLRADDRQIDNFHFWRDRLVILKQVFDEAEPSTISQWWYDRRKGPQWYTFWVAMAVLVLTVFFGIIQSIEGALQVYKAYHPEGP